MELEEDIILEQHLPGKTKGSCQNIFNLTIQQPDLNWVTPKYKHRAPPASSMQSLEI
jgi:hypothetical protein